MQYTNTMIRLPFKKLDVWKKSMTLTKNIYSLTKEFPREELYCLTSQMRRCAISIPSNIAEGSQRTSEKEFRNFLLISKGSLAELETQMLLAIEFKYIQETLAKKILTDADEIGKMLHGLQSKLTSDS